MDIDPKCYTFKRLEVEAGLFDSSVDATYVITLEGNGRYERVIEQLKKYHPTRILYIMNNRGYKRCNKNLKKDLPRYDLTDAFVNVFKHAEQEGYKNVLVLEDDFIFSDKVFEPKTLANVNEFVAARTNTNFIYLLGCLPQIQIPYDRYNNIAWFSGGTHAIIYSRSSRQQAIHDYATTTIDDWDQYYNYKFNRYTYYEPLVYQLFPMTENRKQWAAPDFVLYFVEIYFRFLRLDTDIEPGYSIFYAMSKILFYVILAVPILLVALVVYMCYPAKRPSRTRR
jgi:hypothetical protein